MFIVVSDAPILHGSGSTPHRSPYHFKTTASTLLWKRLMPSNHITSVQSHFCHHLPYIFEDWLFSPLQTKSLTTSLVSSIILQANQFKRLARCVLRFFFFTPKLKFHHDSRFFHQEIKNQPEICQSNQDKFWIFYISFKNFEMFTILIRNG